jgi:hypothetical protein
MPKQKELFPFRVKPKHQVMVRGVEYNEGQTVMMTNEEFNLLAQDNPDCHSRLLPAGEFDAFVADYVAGHIDHTGQPIPEVQEAKENTEAGE